VAEQVAPEPKKEGVEKPKEDLQATGTDSNIE
jgi:predicted small lipoprotein YifL